MRIFIRTDWRLRSVTSASPTPPIGPAPKGWLPDLRAPASGRAIGSAWSLRTTCEFIDLYGAVARLGAILFPVNWRLSAEEVAYVIADAAPKIMIADAANQPLLQAAHSQSADG